MAKSMLPKIPFADKLAKVVVFNLLASVVFAVIYWAIGFNDKNFTKPDHKTGFPGALYFSMTTQSTAGYGDVSPKSVVASVFNFIQLASIIYSAGL